MLMRAKHELSENINGHMEYLKESCCPVFHGTVFCFIAEFQPLSKGCPSVAATLMLLGTSRFLDLFLKTIAQYVCFFCVVILTLMYMI